MLAGGLVAVRAAVAGVGLGGTAAMGYQIRITYPTYILILPGVPIGM